MPRLPQVGSDNGTWGNILNDYLAAAHNSDGTLKDTGALAAKANDTAVLHKDGIETITGAKTFNLAPVVPDGSFATSKVAGLGDKNTANGFAGLGSDNKVPTAHIPDMSGTYSKKGEMWRALLKDGPSITEMALHPNPPTVTFSLTEPTITSPVNTAPFSESITSIGVVPYKHGGGSYLSDTAGRGATYMNAFGLEFELTGDVVYLKLNSIVDTDAKVFLHVFVDGMPLSANPVSTGLTLVQYTAFYLQLQFSSVATRRITIMSRWASVYYIATPATASIMPSTAKRLKVAIVGASFSAYTTAGSAGAVNAFHNLQAWPWEFSRRLGVEILQSAIGGSGYTTATTPTDTHPYTEQLRIDRVSSWSPDLIIIEGSGNDDGTDAATITAAATSVYSAFNTALPGVPIIVIGAMPRGNNTSAINDTNRAINIAAVKAATLPTVSPNVIGFIDPVGTVDPLNAYAVSTAYVTGARVKFKGAVYEALSSFTSSSFTPAYLDTTKWKLLTWFTGTGKYGSTTGDGTRDILTDADGTHPTPLGQRVLAANITREVRKLLIEHYGG